MAVRAAWKTISSLSLLKAFFEEKKIYGIDPVQPLSLGLKLIEQLTEAKRIGVDY